jgi:hypothetical protein
MGNEAVCAVEVDGVRSEAKVLLETDELIVRSPFRLKIPFASMKRIEADDATLRIRWEKHELSASLGRDAAKWAGKMRNPKSLTDKLGIKSGQQISIDGRFDRKFVDQLRECGATVSTRVKGDADIVFLAIEHRDELDRLVGIREALAPDGALWIVRPKGSAAISESEVMAAGKAAGLVDVKVARFSPTHTAEKFVSPVKERATTKSRVGKMTKKSLLP